MITSAMIKIAVNAKLKNVFNLKVHNKMIQKGFERPSFFVEFDNEKRSGSETQIEHNKTIRIYYFPSTDDDVELELLDMKDRLGDVFDLKLTVADRHFGITETTADVTDNIIQFEFDIEFEDGRYAEDVEGNTETMQDLDIDIKKG